LRLQPLGASLPQYFYDGIPFDQVTSLSLGKSRCDVGRHFLALPKHPVFQIELLADDLKSLIQNFAGILIRSDRTASSIMRCCSGLRSIVMGFPYLKVIFFPTGRANNPRCRAASIASCKEN
jgi:hypothetical protein